MSEFNKVEPLRIINIDDTPIAVDELSDEIKQRVDIYNVWRQDHADLRLDILKIENAMNNVSREIISLVRAEKAEEEAKAEAETAEGSDTPAEPTAEAAEG
jgi:hypothetical protein